MHRSLLILTCLVLVAGQLEASVGWSLLTNAQAVCLAPIESDHGCTSAWSAIGLAALLQNEYVLKNACVLRGSLNEST